MLPTYSHCNPATYECPWGQGEVWVKGGSDPTASQFSRRLRRAGRSRPLPK